MKCTPHYHLIDLPSGRKIRTRKDCNTLGEDDELGKFSLGKMFGGIAKGVANAATGGLAGKALGLGKKILGSKGKKVAQQLGVTPIEAASMLAPQIAPQVAGLTHEDLKDIVNSPALKNQLITALHEFNADKASNEKDAKLITSTISPQLNSILSLAKKDALQKQVTYEHNKKVQDSNRWKDNASRQAKILAKLESLEAKLNANSIRNRAIGASFGLPGNLL